VNKREKERGMCVFDQSVCLREKKVNTDGERDKEIQRKRDRVRKRER
jgi:hypothetical protein